ncbi:MAG: asparaginase [Candidatus Aenigmarchaeota archaeon]|nr:asparaginase [Candidatus Aenigmarchaeota archaeon]
MTNKKILFLYNGGTIGQVPENRDGQIVLVPPRDSEIFRVACEPTIEKLKKDMDVTFEFVTAKDSTNMTPNDWEKLIFRIKKAQDEEGYDGVAIAHGTDTLAYTATALALALHGRDPEKSGLRIPVCITGAQNPIYQAGGDGRFNLENLFRTLDAAIDDGIADVLVNFWNRVLLGCRTLKLSERNFDAFQSPSYPNIGFIDAQGVHMESSLARKKENAADKLNLAPKFGRGVISFELTPGIDPNVVLGFITNGGISAMILKSLGEGNVCNEGQYNLLPVIKQATEDYMIPIFITTKFAGGSAVAAHYEVGIAAIKAGGIACFDHTDVAVDVKVRWLIGNGICQNIGDFRNAMRISFAGEVKLPKA